MGFFRVWRGAETGMLLRKELLPPFLWIKEGSNTENIVNVKRDQKPKEAHLDYVFLPGK